MCLRSRGRAEFRRRRKKSPAAASRILVGAPAASRIWFAPAGKVAAAPLRGLVTVAISVAVCEIFSVKEWRDLENHVGVVQGH